jgi:hypothetical protein
MRRWEDVVARRMSVPGVEAAASADLALSTLALVRVLSCWPG